MASGTAFIPTLNHWICHIKHKISHCFDLCGTVSCRRHVFIVFENQTYFKYVMRPKKRKKILLFGPFSGYLQRGVIYAFQRVVYMLKRYLKLFVLG